MTTEPSEHPQRREQLVAGVLVVGVLQLFGAVYLDGAFIGLFDLAVSPTWQLAAVAIVVGWLATLTLAIRGLRLEGAWGAVYWVTIIALAVELLLNALLVASLVFLAIALTLVPI